YVCIFLELRTCYRDFVARLVAIGSANRERAQNAIRSDRRGQRAVRAKGGYCRGKTELARGRHRAPAGAFGWRFAAYGHHSLEANPRSHSAPHRLPAPRRLRRELSPQT